MKKNASEHAEPLSLLPDWRTARPSLRVLVVLHSVTAAARISDVLPIFHDRRVQMFCVQTSGAVFAAGVDAYITEHGFFRLTWQQAVDMEFDLVITASLGDNLYEIDSPILRLPHGNGYNKYALGDSGTRGLGDSGTPGAFGLSADSLKHEGRLVPAAIALSHTEQFDRLAQGCRDALPRAFVAGDPCYDRLLADLPHRLRYRSSLGLVPGTRLITVNSTWHEDSLFGLDPGFVARLLSELPRDEFRIALILHPNVWSAHSEMQIRSWLFDALRAGLILIPPHDGWRAAVVAADWVLSDHGSVSVYAAAAGRPVLLDSGGRSAVDPRSALGRLFEVAPKLDRRAPLGPQLLRAERSLEQTRATAQRWVSSAPGRSLRLIRQEAYRIIGAPAPDSEPPLLADPAPDVGQGPPPSLWTRVRQVDPQDPGKLELRRFPAAVNGAPPAESRGDTVLVASAQESDHRLLGLADIVRIPLAELPADEDAWSREVFQHRSGAQLTVVYDGGGGARMRTRDGRTVSVLVDSISDPGDTEPVLTALAARALAHGAGGAGGHPAADIAALSPVEIRIGADRAVTAEIRATAW